MDIIIIIASIVSSDKILINPKSITISKTVIVTIIIIRINTTNKIFLVKNLIFFLFYCIFVFILLIYTIIETYHTITLFKYIVFIDM